MPEHSPPSNEAPTLLRPSPDSSRAAGLKSSFAVGDSAPPPHPGPQEPEIVGPGSVLAGKYRLVRELGRGGMGIVFLAEGLLDRQQYAIKVLSDGFRLHPDSLEALREEARKSLALRHPNIVGVYPLERDGTTFFLPMEYLDGKTVRAVLDDEYARGMPRDHAFPLVRAVGSALSYAHDHGVIHSDLKPSNVFLTTSGSPRVLDFGIARTVRSRDGRFDVASLGALTIAYASAEMVAGEQPDFRDDVYGFACIIYEMLTGGHPYNGHSAAEAREKNLSPAPIVGLSDTQNAALRSGLAFDRNDRARSIEELLLVCETTQRPRPLAVNWIALAAGSVSIIALIAWTVWSLLLGANEGPSAESPPFVERTPVLPEQTSQVPRGGVTAAAQEVGRMFSECLGCPKMVVIPAGTFRMSSSREEQGRRENELPQRIVQFRNPFAISESPVTRRQFQVFLNSTERREAGNCADATSTHRAAVSFANPGFQQSDDHPIVCVSPDEAVAYADWLSRQVGAPYRLPTEAEWEYVARAGKSTPFPWGRSEEDACRFGNFLDRGATRREGSASSPVCVDGYTYTSPVGSFPANNWGLHDVVGNVRQWALTCPHLPGPYGEDGSEWLECERVNVVIRGASFATLLGEAATRSSMRTELPHEAPRAWNDVGFRVVRSL